MENKDYLLVGIGEDSSNNTGRRKGVHWMREFCRSLSNKQ